MLIGNIVKSMCGHDKGSFYIVVKSEAGFVYIVDGRTRKLEKPKRKNANHIATTKKFVDVEKLDTDKKIRHELWNLNFGFKEDM